MNGGTRDGLYFTFSDTVAGYVVERTGLDLRLRLLDGGETTVHLTDTTTGRLLHNLGEPYRDITAVLWDHLAPGVLVFCHGPLYPDPSAPAGLYHQAGQLIVTGERERPYLFEEPGWWTRQLDALARFYFSAQFGAQRGDADPDFTGYRTELRGTGHKTGRRVQETDTISRLVYGMAAAHLLTGEEDYLRAARAGSRYLHDHLRFSEPADGIVHWYHGLELTDTGEHRLFASEFGDDYQAIPAYEQIYALVGLVHTYRLTGDPLLAADIEGTLRFFGRYFADRRQGGWYSHIDPVTFSPHHDSLGPNRSRKNWNSVGDHAPAYLFNLLLATGEERHLRMLEHSFDMIVTHMPDHTAEAGPFVFERFHADWTPDREWGWQRDRAVVGHNLKIAWNLTRMAAALPKPEYRKLAAEIGRTMPAAGGDRRRGGWYDILQRSVRRGGHHAFVWHDRKTWWQQEQAILAYLIMAGHTQDRAAREEWLALARESAAFYNAFFLDHDEGGVHFSVLAEGLPYHLGDERLKGNHAMSLYHKAELAYLAEVYTRLLIHDDPLTLWFRPRPDAAFPGRVLRVAPDVLPPGRVVLAKVYVDGSPYDRFDADLMAVQLPESAHELTVQAVLRPASQGERP